jgi:hypothetical protein
MERDKERRPPDDEEIRRKGEEARKHLDEIPPPGTDPLHEGP